MFGLYDVHNTGWGWTRLRAARFRAGRFRANGVEQSSHVSRDLYRVPWMRGVYEAELKRQFSIISQKLYYI